MWNVMEGNPNSVAVPDVDHSEGDEQDRERDRKSDDRRCRRKRSRSRTRSRSISTINVVRPADIGIERERERGHHHHHRRPERRRNGRNRKLRHSNISINSSEVSPVLSVTKNDTMAKINDEMKILPSKVTENGTNANLKSDEYVDTKNYTKSNLKIEMESLSRQHHLAHIHFARCEECYHSTPIILFALAGGVMSFLASLSKNEPVQSPGYYNNTINENGDDPVISQRTGEILSISVGILSFLQVAWQKLGKSWNFGERSVIHKEVFLGLNRLLDKIEKDEKIKESLKTDEGKGTSIRMDLMSPSAQMQTYYEVYEQCLASCNSPIPIRVKSAFNLLKYKMRLAMKDREEEMSFKDQLYFRYAFDALFNRISISKKWPLCVIDPQEAVEYAYNDAIGLNKGSVELAQCRYDAHFELRSMKERHNQRCNTIQYNTSLDNTHHHDNNSYVPRQM